MIIAKWQKQSFDDNTSALEYLIKDWFLEPSRILNQGEEIIGGRIGKWFVYKTDEVVSTQTQQTELGQKEITNSIPTQAKIYFLEIDPQTAYTLYFSTLEEDFSEFTDVFEKIASSFQLEN